jgi:hypothetical protein
MEDGWMMWSLRLGRVEESGKESSGCGGEVVS